jgi:hypothetical protein
MLLSSLGKYHHPVLPRTTEEQFPGEPKLHRKFEAAFYEWQLFYIFEDDFKGKKKGKDFTKQFEF